MKCIIYNALVNNALSTLDNLGFGVDPVISNTIYVCNISFLLLNR